MTLQEILLTALLGSLCIGALAMYVYFKRNREKPVDKSQYVLASYDVIKKMAETGNYKGAFEALLKVHSATIKDHGQFLDHLLRNH